MAVQFKKLKTSNSFMKELGCQRYYEFEDQIIRGLPSRAIAGILQYEGFYKSIKKESLAATIRAFRRDTILPKLKRFIDSEPKTNVARAAKVISEQCDVALEFSNLIDIQWERLERALDEEYETGEITLTASRELRLLKEIMTALGRFQIQAGVVNTRGSSLGGYHADSHMFDGGTISFNVDPVTKRQIAIATKKAMKVFSSMNSQNMTS